MKQTILWSYSLLFRIGGVVMAVMSGIVSGAIGIGIAKDGYILVNGRPEFGPWTIATGIGTPLIGVVLGLALFYFVPKVRRTSE
jgi:hypothetical protein